MLFKNIFLVGALQAAMATAAVMPDIDLSKEITNPTSIIENLLKDHTPQELNDIIGKVKGLKTTRDAAVMPDIDLSKEGDTSILDLLKKLTPDALEDLINKVKSTPSTKRDAALSDIDLSKILPKETAPVVLDGALKSLKSEDLSTIVNQVKNASASSIESFIKDKNIDTVKALLGDNTSAITLIQTLLKLIKTEELTALLNKIKSTSLADIEKFAKNHTLDDVKSLLSAAAKTTKRGVAFSA
ncbi:hypothetical protein P280DRAFT_200502 [Massarina eburnea CBS 473.64]|uniref:Uncharacterized protein n=1 Tax=Massarina eburnea CBS 473.64 TaxID=1395130 RepID=A0A6A6RI20_9PLEO|nr:hypothetical protein P280DRAFT_200502 [Massarina eburnea CBS 473.64]